MNRSAIIRSAPARAGAVTLALLAALAGCGDGPAGGSSLPLAGSYTARTATLGGGSDLIDDGYIVALRVDVAETPPIYRLVLMPPPVDLAPPTIYEGYTEAVTDERIRFYTRGLDFLDAARVSRSNDRTVLEFEQGTFSVRRVELVTATGPDPAGFDGRFSARSFSVRGSDGTAREPDEPPSMTFDTGARQYTFDAGFSPGTLAETAVAMQYDGRFDTAGPLLILGGGFGCDAFVASVALGDRLALRGVACDVAGRKWVIEGEFESD